MRGLSYILVAVFLLSLALPSCIRRNRDQPSLDVNLFTGIPDRVRLGENETSVLNKMKGWQYQREEYAESSGAERSLFSHSFEYRQLGIKVYFQRSQVILIELQDPFRGTIQSKKLAIFQLATPPDVSWEDYLSRQFGPPNQRVTGGRLGSASLFYGWGDISYNHTGPNEIALYRDPRILEYRQGNFGRVLRLFPE